MLARGVIFVDIHTSHILRDPRSRVAFYLSPADSLEQRQFPYARPCQKLARQLLS
jgi:hypothetical protein